MCARPVRPRPRTDPGSPVHLVIPPATMVGVALVLSLASVPVHAQPFVEIPSGMIEVWAGAAEWGDVDGDGDLDVALQGFASGGDAAALYENVGGSFVDTGLAIPPRSRGRCTWFDPDRDGDLDLLVTGSGITTRYRNDGGTLVEVATSIPGLDNVAVDVGDLDGDGDDDLLMLGLSITDGSRTRLYRNQGDGSFVEEVTAIPDLWRGSIDLADVDADGDLDALVTGIGGVFLHTDLYRNQGDGTFVGDGLPILLYDGEGALADLDGDGDPDLLVAGSEEGSTSVDTRVFWNDGGAFVDSGLDLDGAGEGGSITLGDADVDGDLDYAAIGNVPGGSVYYRNDGGTFTFVDELVGVCCGTIRFGDLENDGDLDLLQVALVQNTTLLRNDVALTNTAPSAPTGLEAEVDGAFVTLRWTSGTDAETVTTSLTHAVRVGSGPGGVNVIAPRADPITGTRRVPDHGNAGWNCFRVLGPLPPGTYHWSVQAVDAGYLGSAFAPEATFVIEGTVGVPGDADPGPVVAWDATSPIRTGGLVRLDLGRAATVRLEAFDVTGRRLARLLHRPLDAGRHEVAFDASAWPVGVVLLRLQTETGSSRHRVVRLP